MLRKRRAQSSSLFLMELILSILFFSIASAACVQIFVKSHTLSTRASALDLAVSDCSKGAEAIRSADDPAQAAELLLAIYPDCVIRRQDAQEAQVQVFFDDAGKPCAQEGFVYRMDIQIGFDAAASSLMKGEITYYAAADEDPLYSLTAAKAVRRDRHA